MAWSPSATRYHEGSVILGQPCETLGVDIQVRQRWGRRTLCEQRTDRFALVEPERSYVYETDHLPANASDVWTTS